MDLPLICVCGCSTWTRRKKHTPASLQPYAERQYWCATCNAPCSPVAYKRTSFFWLCFIPLVPYHFGHPYLGCPRCKRPVDYDAGCHPCLTCAAPVLDSSSFCAHCGTGQTASQHHATQPAAISK